MTDTTTTADTITRALLAEAAAYGVTLTVAPDDDTPADAPGILYAVDGPGPDRRTVHRDDDSAAADLRARVGSLQDAAEAAANRAARWDTIKRTATDDVAAWRELAAEVDALLPDGCVVPTPNPYDPFGLSGWPPMTACVADALAAWTAQQRDQAARDRLAAAVAAEGAEVRDAADQPQHRPDYWQTVVEVWQPLQAVREPGDRPEVRRGRVLTDQDTRRVVAWRHYGVAVAAGVDAVDAAADQLERARGVVADAAQQHRDAADRLTGALHL
jgi:hypothetical protein